MTDHSEGNPPGDVPQRPDHQSSGEGRDIHPAIDPREPVETSPPESHREAPPLDIDERPDHATSSDIPNVIELSEHTDGLSVESGDIANDDWQDTATDPEEPGRDDVGATSESAAIPPDAAEAVTSVVDDTHQATTVDEDFEAPEDPSSSAPDNTASPSRAQEPADSGKGFAKASAMFSGAASKIGLGKLLETNEDPEPTGPKQTASSTTKRAARTGLAGLPARLEVGLRRFLDPRLHMFSTAPHRRVVAGAAVLGLLCLLANSGGLALIVLSSVVPLLILITITQHDVFEKESNLLVAAVAGAGAVAGIILSAIAAWIQGNQWFDEGVLNFGAGGFGGRFADAAGSAPVIVWLIVGLVIPAIAIFAIAGLPTALRRWPQFRNEVMDGMILTGASATGFSIGASLVYWWPMIADSGPQTNVSDWTLSVIGVGVLRPAITTLCGAMIGAGVWRYMIRPSTSVILLPGIGGVGGYLLLTFGSIQFQPSGNWPELIWTLLIALAVFLLYRRVLDQAVATDRLALGNEDQRIVCPSCHKVTPPGAFCAHCGQRLTPEQEPAEDEPTASQHAEFSESASDLPDPR